MPARTRPLDKLMIIAADARETVRAARQSQSEGVKQIAKSNQAIKESHEVVQRADESLRRCGPGIAMPDETPADPTCPNCGEPMTLISPPNGLHDHHTFECKGCKVVYMTDDHTPISGRHPPQSS